MWMSSEMPQPQHTQQAVAVALSDAHGVEPINGTAFVDFCFFHDKDVATMAAGIGSLLALLLVFAVSLWARRNIAYGSADRLSYVLLPIYNILLQAICALLLIRFVCFSLISKTSLAFDFASFVVSCPLTASLRDGIAVILVQNSAGFDAMRWAAAFMLLWCIGMGALGWFYFLGSDHYANLFQSDFWVLYNVVAAALHVVILLVKLVQYVGMKKVVARRPGPVAYSITLAVMLAGFAVIAVCANHGTIHACAWSILDVCYNFTWPLMAYQTLRLDSKFWRAAVGSVAKLKDIGMPLLGSVELEDAHIIDFAQIQFGSVIAVGGTASVLRAKYKGRRVAVKRFMCNSLRAEEAYSYAREIGMLSRLEHLNVVALYGVCVIPPYVCLVMEHMSRGSLFHVLTKERRVRRAIRRLASPSMPNAHLLLSQLVSPSRFLFLMRDAWRGLAFLHEGPHVVHGDIKSLNLLIDNNWVLKLCDFGESQFARSTPGTIPALPRAASQHLRSLQTGATAASPRLQRPPGTIVVRPSASHTATAAAFATGTARGGTPWDEKAAAPSRRRSETQLSVVSSTAGRPAVSIGRAPDVGGDGSGAAGPDPSSASSEGYSSMPVSSSAAVLSLKRCDRRHSPKKARRRAAAGAAGAAAAKAPHAPNGDQWDIKQTPHWAAPEVFSHKRYSPASDVYSLGMVMFEMFALRPPFHQLPNRRIGPLVMDGIRPQLPPEVGASLREMIHRCWAHEPEARPSAAEVLRLLDSLTPAEAGIGVSVRSQQAKNNVAVAIPPTHVGSDGVVGPQQRSCHHAAETVVDGPSTVAGGASDGEARRA